MRIIAYCALHYGSPYLAHAIRSVIDHVDEILILYSPHGSHGTQTNSKPPESESRDNLYQIAMLASGNKLTWVDGNWRQEHEHRNARYDYAPDADVFLTLDYDEIWPDTLGGILDLARDGQLSTYNRLPMIHFWRSFHRAVLHDPAYPSRIEVVHDRTPTWMDTETDSTLHTKPICHMGYAIPTDLVKYKWQIHGHFPEYRKDIDWLYDRWTCNADTDCHPVGSEHWNPVMVDPLDYLPSWMRMHPYYGKDVIE